MNRQRPIPPSRREAGRMNSAAPPAMGDTGDPPVTVPDISGPTGAEQVIWFKPVAFTEHGTTLPLFRTPQFELRTQDASHSDGSKLIQPNPTKSPLRNPPPSGLPAGPKAQAGALPKEELRVPHLEVRPSQSKSDL